MRYTLNSDELSVSLNSKGAELCSIKNKQGHEYLWQGSPEIWPRQAPVLFPIVGKLKNNAYFFENHHFSMSQHGFARDEEFALYKHEANELAFVLGSDNKSKLAFPFDFELKLTYTLNGNALKCGYEVNNVGKGSMYFSLGAHPGFNLAFAKQTTSATPYLQFKKTELLLSALNNGLLAEEKRVLTIPNGCLYLQPLLFANDALVLEGAQIDQVTLSLDEDGRAIQLRCPGWPYFGIWSKPDPIDGNLKFLCLEPWYGVADSQNHNGNLVNKKGVLELSEGKTFGTAFELHFF